MGKITVLNEKVIKELLTMNDVVDIVEEAYKMKNSQQADLFPIITHIFEPGKADMDIKSGHLKGNTNIFGLKLVSWFGDNIKKQFPDVIGTIMIFDATNGVPMGILSGEHITGMRTGAAGAIGSKYLARQNSKNILMIGTGHQAFYQIAANLMVLENIERVMVYNPHHPKSAIRFCEEIQERLNLTVLSHYKNNEKVYKKIAHKYNINFSPVDDIKNSTGEADIIITATPSNKPLIRAEWVKSGTHFNCIGADMLGKQEIDENIFSNAKIIVDDIEQAITVGETKVPIQEGTIKKEDIIAEIGEVIMKEKKGRNSKKDITIFDSTGIAHQDLITAFLALKKAKEKNLGTVVDL